MPWLPCEGRTSVQTHSERPERITQGNKRRYPRLGKSLDLTVEAAGTRWEGKAAGLSLYGMKVSPPEQPVHLSQGDTVHLRLPLPNQGSPLSLTASVVRTDADGIALSFLDLVEEQAQRLQEFVDSLLLQEMQKAEEQKMMPEKRSETPSDTSSEQDISQELLRRVGLEGLQFPRDAALSRQWRDFLDYANL